MEQIDALRETIHHKDEIVYSLASKLSDFKEKKTNGDQNVGQITNYQQIDAC